MDSGYLSFQDISALRTEIDTSLNQRPVSPSTVVNAIAWMRRQGSATAGMEVKFPLATWGNRAQKRNPYENLPATKPENVIFSVTHDEWAPDGSDRPWYAAHRPVRHFQRELADDRRSGTA